MSVPRKSILLAVPDHVGFPEVFQKNLEYLGYNVIPLSVPPFDKFKYKNIIERAHNLVKKVIFKDKNFKHQLFLKHNKVDLLQKLTAIEKVDYTLIIRPDQYPIEAVEQIKSKSNKVIGYQWDGLDRYPQIYKYIPLMDRFFVFDTKDLVVKNSLPLTNFYFDYLPQRPVYKQSKVYYIGSYLENRIEIIKDINDKLELLEEKRNIKIVTNQKSVIKYINTIGLSYISNIITYEENLKEVFESSILIDIQNPVHNGLSFRIFEGLGYDKKVITTNTEVKNYDFYHPNNILIWNNQNEKEILDFIECPYHVISPQLKLKYSFSNWIKYVLDDSEYIEIGLPKGK